MESTLRMCGYNSGGGYVSPEFKELLGFLNTPRKKWELDEEVPLPALEGYFSLFHSRDQTEDSYSLWFLKEYRDLMYKCIRKDVHIYSESTMVYFERVLLLIVGAVKVPYVENLLEGMSDHSSEVQDINKAFIRHALVPLI